MDKKLFADLVESVKEMKRIRRGEATLAKTTYYACPGPKEIRLKTGMSKRRFAFYIGVKPSEYKKWERKNKFPYGMATVLMWVVDYDPEIIKKAARYHRREFVG
jgi:DNA-binding transcriptional regulator YiaG